MLDAGLRPRPFPDDTASLLPGLLTATRTGLTPASDDELTNQPSTIYMINHQLSGHTKEFPYEIDGGTEQLERTVLQALRRHITDGEWDDIKSLMPKDLATVLP